MTFYEAALRVLESAGKPLSFLEITQRSIEQNLLSHIGKTPEQTMLSRLAAMARRPRDRKVIVTGKDTFALADWALPEDAEALAQMATPEPNPEASQPVLRPPERHPDSRLENLRVAGRGSERRKWREEEDFLPGRGRRPAIPEIVFNVLSESPSALKPADIIAGAKAQELLADEVTQEQLLTALLEDNQRRIDADRRPQFVLNPQTGEISLEKAGVPSEAPPIELQAAFAQALGISLEGGRPALPRGHLPADVTEELASIGALRVSAREARRAVARGLKQRLAELDLGTFEKSVVRMLHGNGFRDAKIAKRSRDTMLVTCRRRDGVTELRYAARLIRGANSVDRKNVQELRRELGHYSAQVGLVISPGDARGDARAEAQSGGGLILLWCGDALGEKFIEAKTGVSVAHLDVFEIDSHFFEAARIDAEEARRRREERMRERAARMAVESASQPVDASGASESQPSETKAEGASSVEPESAAQATSGFHEESEEGDLDGDGEPLEASEATETGGTNVLNAGRSSEARPTAERQRRRRRRGRRSRGHRPVSGGPPPAREAETPAAAPAEARQPEPAPTGPAQPSEGVDPGSSGSQA